MELRVIGDKVLTSEKLFSTSFSLCYDGTELSGGGSDAVIHLVRRFPHSPMCQQQAKVMISCVPMMILMTMILKQ